MASLIPWGALSGLFADEADGLRGALLGQTPESNHALSPDLQAIAAHERLLPVGALDESAAGALIDEHELVAVDLDARMQARDQVAFDHDVVVLGAADGDTRVPLVDQQLAVIASQPQPHGPRRTRLGRDAGNHAGHILGLPQHL